VSRSATTSGVPRRRIAGRYWVLALAALAGVLGGVLAAVATRSGPAPKPTAPNASWGPGRLRAPGFELRDQSGQLVSLRSLRGQRVIVSFLDPVCRNLCPLEARELARVERNLGPALVAVSVNPWADSRASFAADARAWRLPATWRWATGPKAKLERVWREYKVDVVVRRRTVAGLNVRDVAHTEAVYLIDRAGYLRALYIYPFHAADLEYALRTL
jgi:cytochrome oxidase Cu insertion factor (SCO1/SenC/PrrC family)